MKQPDMYYRAFSEYMSISSKEKENVLFRKALMSSADENSRLSVTRTICHVDENWIRAIEEGLVFIEKAIKEERQFIYTTGEVEPIEKVKHISKDSVRHLAKHSEMITRKQTEAEIIPDKLYSVEKLNDYAVYENRFLYMLLCYLRDFVNVRYIKIVELTNKYQGELLVEKEVTHGDRKVSYQIKLSEVRDNDRYLSSLNTAEQIIDRIELIQRTIVAFLATPLMESAGKAAMLKPPITKTNVLKMDNNFKHTVALYEYVVAYEGEGFTAERRSTDITKFRGELSAEISEACALLSFLTYEHGLGIRPLLELEYEKVEQQKKALEKSQRDKLIASLKRKLKGLKITPEEYISELEKQVKILKSDSSKLEPMKMEIGRLKECEAALEIKIKDLRDEVKLANDELTANEKKHISEFEGLRAEYDDRIILNGEKYRAEKEAMEESHRERIAALNGEMKEAQEKWKDESEALKAEIETLKKERDKALKEKAELIDGEMLRNARTRALLIENGVMPQEDFTDKESFDVLESEYNAFKSFYTARWKEAKKKIRREILNIDNLKALNKRKKDKE